MAIAFSAPSLTDVLQPAFRQFVPLARGLAAALGENPRKVPGYCPRRALGEIGRAFKAPTRSATARKMNGLTEVSSCYAKALTSCISEGGMRRA